MEHAKSKSDTNKEKRRGQRDTIDDSDPEQQPISRGQAVRLAAVFIVPLILLMLYGIYGG